MDASATSKVCCLHAVGHIARVTSSRVPVVHRNLRYLFIGCNKLLQAVYLSFPGAPLEANCSW